MSRSIIRMSPAQFAAATLDTRVAYLDGLLAMHRSVWGDLRMEETGGDGGDGDTNAGGDAGQQSPPSNLGQQPTQQQQGERVEDLPEWAQKIIRDTRSEAATRRATAEQQAQQAAQDAQDELTQKLGKALGLIKDGDDGPGADELTAQIEAAQAAQRQAAVELAVYRAAAKHQGDPDALLDSRAFLAKVGELDPTGDDFAAQVDAAIKSAVADNPKLKTARAAGSSSADHAGGSGEKTRTPKSLDDAVAAHYGTA